MVVAIAVALLLVLTAGVTACGSAKDGAAPSSSAADGESVGSASSAPTQADVQAFVEKAVDYARTHEKDEALTAFTASGGEFHQGELYIYAYDFDGTVIAHGGDPALVGRDLIGMKDPNGVPVIKELVRLAEQGSGWLYYTWPNPEHGDRQEPKLGYVMKVDDEWFVGSGTYGPAAVPSASEAEITASDEGALD